MSVRLQPTSFRGQDVLSLAIRQLSNKMVW